LEEQRSLFFSVERHSRVLKINGFMDQFVVWAKKTGNKGKTFFSLAAANMVQCLGCGNAVDPGAKPGIAFKLINGTINLNEYLLGNVFGIRTVLNNTQCRIIYQVLIVRYQ
jgi:hypothetical protein